MYLNFTQRILLKICIQSTCTRKTHFLSIKFFKINMLNEQIKSTPLISNNSISWPYSVVWGLPHISVYNSSTILVGITNGRSKHSNLTLAWPWHFQMQLVKICRSIQYFDNVSHLDLIFKNMTFCLYMKISEHKCQCYIFDLFQMTLVE